MDTNINFEFKYKKPKLIAEIGCNHKGDLDTAIEMIKVAAQFCNADYVKFQKRNPKELLTKEEYNAPHPNPANSYGKTYGEHREFLEFDIEQHQQLKKMCKEWGIGYSCSVWDITSTREIVSLNPDFIKIPSACNLKFDIYDYLFENYTNDIHVSLGMTQAKEIEEIFNYFNKSNKLNKLILYHCTSGYPIKFEEANLLEITRLKKNYQNSVKAIGFSGHHLGIAIDIAAYTLGAEWIERHYTLDRTQKGTDHAASLEPDGIRKLKRNLEATYKSLTFKERDILEIENVQRKKLKRF